MNQQGFRVDINPDVKPDLICDIHELSSHLHDTFDIIFADPPYDHPGVKELPDFIFQYQLLKEGGWFIQEHSSRHSFEGHPRFFQHRTYGDVNFTIMK